MTTVAQTKTVAERVWAALDTVRDPELDEPVTTLRFVTEVRVLDGREVVIRLRLPAYFCAPNFAYLMVADAHDAVAALPEVDAVTVLLEDHFAAEQINAGVADGAGFTGSFPGEATRELDELRKTFQRKAYIAALERVVRKLSAADRMTDAPLELTLGDVPDGRERTSLLRRRAAIGLGNDPGAMLLVDEHGAALQSGDLAIRLRYARAVRVSIEGNAHFCRGLLATRYGETSSTTTYENGAGR
ncbi:iron-sulfur cluster assembly protein [Nocardia colli]|uniref:Iron-sulfur cluster assembly protein n=1 Tax=Nocardia colli TaxID=2545717 RepID=A0A5N0EAW0_9NOCA|nr:iron-sulfur cluster assembly protein [Nocardia colli]KAA8886557.1 iron-sulfur cluster assembly protein [Nocardia colli]